MTKRLNYQLKLQTVSTVVVLVVVLLGNTVTSAQARSPSGLSSLLWQIPRILCHDPTQCRLEFRVSSTNALYVLNLADWILTVFPSGQQHFTQYTLSDYFSDVDPRFDFTPFGDDFVLIFNPIRNKGPIFKYELASRTLSLFSSKPEEGFTSCSSFLVPPVASFSRFGPDDLLLTCSQTEGATPEQSIHRLIVVNPLTGKANAAVDIPGPVSSVHPWYRVLGGHDGRLYLQANGYMFAAPGASISMLVKRYELQSGNWSTIAIQEQSVVGWDAGRLDHGVIRRSELIGVDRASNLYFDLSWYDQAKYHFRLVTIGPQGQTLSTLAASDFEGVIPEIVEVMPDGSLIFAVSVSSDVTAFEIRQVPPPAAIK